MEQADKGFFKSIIESMGSRIIHWAVGIATTATLTTLAVVIGFYVKAGPTIDTLIKNDYRQDSIIKENTSQTKDIPLTEEQVKEIFRWMEKTDRRQDKSEERQIKTYEMINDIHDRLAKK